MIFFIALISALCFGFFKEAENPALFIEGEIISVKSAVGENSIEYIAAMDDEKDSVLKSTVEILIDKTVAEEFFEYQGKKQRYFAYLKKDDLEFAFHKRK